jgi:hypothetical protein
MENASKALIIAGAILLSILIIALGIYVFNIAKSAVNTDQLSSVEKDTFNKTFTMYEGEQIGSDVKALLSNVISNIGTNKDSDERLPDIQYVDTGKGPSFKVGTQTFGGNNGSWKIISNVSNSKMNEISALRSGIASSHYYTVDFTMDDQTGLVSLIKITY